MLRIYDCIEYNGNRLNVDKEKLEEFFKFLEKEKPGELRDEVLDDNKSIDLIPLSKIHHHPLTVMTDMDGICMKSYYLDTESRVYSVVFFKDKDTNKLIKTFLAVIVFNPKPLGDDTPNIDVNKIFIRQISNLEFSDAEFIDIEDSDEVISDVFYFDEENEDDFNYTFKYQFKDLNLSLIMDKNDVTEGSELKFKVRNGRDYICLVTESNKGALIKGSKVY